MDQDAKDLVRQASAGTVEGFFNTVGAALSELGQWGADFIRLHRLKTQTNTLRRAMKMCEEAGIDPRAIDLKTLVPLLQNLSLEEDPEDAEDPAAAEAMQERWAALLANAASGDDGADVPPSFPRILAELVPEEATMLEWLAKQSAGSTLDSFKSQVGFDFTKSNREQPVYDVYVNNLERLQLISVEREDHRLTEFQRNVEDRIKKIDRDSWGARRLTTGHSWERVELTALGRAFIAACTPPVQLEERGQDDT